MTFTFRPAVREHTPLVIGLAGPTKSGKTYSAHRLAVGLANGGPVAMINCEGQKGHQYAGTFKYVACDLSAPYRPTAYTEALQAATAINPAVVIVDSASHMHDGPGGILEWHEEILDRIAGTDYAKRQRSTFAAWVEPKAAENHFIYTMLEMKCHVILCFRAKEKIKIVKGRDPIDLGWQPIAGERVAFETIFTLMLPPHSKGIPDLSISDMREPFDAMVPEGKPIDENLGRRLAEWARGGAPKPMSTQPPDRKADLLAEIKGALSGLPDNAAKSAVCAKVLGVRTWAEVEKLPLDVLEGALIPVAIGGPSKIEAACIEWKEAHHP